MLWNDENLGGWVTRIYDLSAAGLLSVLGGSAAYLYKTVKEDTGFSFKHFFINAFLAFFIGNMVGNFVPATAEYRDGFLMLAGFATWPILGIMEFYGRRVVLKWLDNKLGMDESAHAIEDQRHTEGNFFPKRKEATEDSTDIQDPVESAQDESASAVSVVKPSMRILISDRTYRK